MAKYNITRIVPEGFMHSAGFLEIIDSLSWSLAALGHEVNVTQNWLSEVGETNIIFGAELLAEFQRLPRNTVIYNLEQPSHLNMEKVRRLARESSATVWDYSSRSAAEWKSLGHERVCHVPIGFTPNLTRILRASTQDIDVLFVGWLTPRRIAIIDALRAASLNVYASAACYGGGRDNLISRAKVCLNIHHDGRDRFEIVRCSYLMANSKCIVTEISGDDDEYADLSNGLSRAPYRILVDTCVSYCNTGTERAHMEDAARSVIRKRDYTVVVAAALDTPPSSAPSRGMGFRLDRQRQRHDFLHKARVLANDGSIDARYTKALMEGDMKDFVSWLRGHARGNVMEIGVRDGASTSAFLLGVEDNGGHVYSVDTQDCSHLFSSPQWTFIHANSTDYATVTRQIPYELDILLIDGDHSRAGVLADWEYARQVRPGGLVLFHDIAPEEKPSGCTDMSWPGDDARRVYFELCESLAAEGWTHEELPGRYGLGVLRRPLAAVPKEAHEDSISV